MAVYPEEFKYAKTHEWLKEEDGLFLIGISDYAQQKLGAIVFVNLPEVGDIVTVGDIFADVESVKVAADIYSPVTGTVAEINEALLDSPELVNEAPFDSWFVKVASVTETEELLDAAAYEAHCMQEEEE